MIIEGRKKEDDGKAYEYLLDIIAEEKETADRMIQYIREKVEKNGGRLETRFGISAYYADRQNRKEGHSSIIEFFIDRKDRLMCRMGEWIYNKKFEEGEVDIHDIIPDNLTAFAKEYEAREMGTTHEEEKKNLVNAFRIYAGLEWDKTGMTDEEVKRYYDSVMAKKPGSEYPYKTAPSLADDQNYLNITGKQNIKFFDIRDMKWKEKRMECFKTKYGDDNLNNILEFCGAIITEKSLQRYVPVEYISYESLKSLADQTRIDRSLYMKSENAENRENGIKRRIKF